MLDSCKARMEQGELRVDANISVRRPGGKLGVRTEVKNLNSVRSVSRAIEYEVARQISLLERDLEVENETRSFDVFTKRTIAMRDKEAKQDYRFMPEPNLPPLRLCDSSIETPTSPHMVDIAPLRESLPELPAQIRERLVTEQGLKPAAAAQLVFFPDLLGFFRLCLAEDPVSVKEVAELVLNMLAEHCNLTGQEVSEAALIPRDLVEASNMRQRREISFTALREVIKVLLQGEQSGTRSVVESLDLFLVNDEQIISEFVRDVMEGNDKLVRKLREAKDKKKRLKSFQSLLLAANKDSRARKVDMAVFSRILENRTSSQE